MNRAASIWEQAGGQESGGYADTLMVRAAIQVRMGDQGAATMSYRSALTVLQLRFGPTHPDLAPVKNSLAIVLALQGDRVAAIPPALEAEKIVRDHLTLTVRYLAERQALDYVARHEALDILLSLATANASLAAPVLDRVVRARSLTLDEMASRHHAAADTAEPGVDDLRLTLSSARQRLANLVVRGAGRQRPEQYAALLDDVTRQKELAERALLEKSVVFRSEMERADVGLSAVQAALPARSALLSFYRYDRITFPDRPRASTPSPQEPESSRFAPRLSTVPFYVAFVLRPGVSDPQIVSLGDAAAIDDLVEEWRKEGFAGLGADGSSAASERKLRQLGTQVRRRLWEPLAPHLAGAERVFIVPDGLVNLIPLSALPVGSTSYLVDAGPTLHYLSTERDLVVPPGLSAVGHGLLALGAPSFADSSPFVAPDSRATSSANRVSVPFRGTISECPSFQTMDFGLLPATGKEAAYVAGLWKEFGPVASGASVGPKGPPRSRGGRAQLQATEPREPRPASGDSRLLSWRLRLCPRQHPLGGGLGPQKEDDDRESEGARYYCVGADSQSHR